MQVASVASMFVSRWDQAVKPLVPPALQHRLGVAMAMRSYQAHHELLAIPRWRRLARRRRPAAAAALGQHRQQGRGDACTYVQALAAPGTIDTLPEKTLQAWADHGALGAPMLTDGGDAEPCAAMRHASVDVDAVGHRLQRDGVEAFALSWHSMLARIAEKCAAAGQGGT